MATHRVYTILSRTAVQGQPQVQPYDQGAIDFHDTGPIWYIATLDHDVFTVYDFDDANSIWVRTAFTHQRQDVLRSLFSEIDIVGMAFDDEQTAITEDLASIAVSPRLRQPASTGPRASPRVLSNPSRAVARQLRGERAQGTGRPTRRSGRPFV